MYAAAALRKRASATGSTPDERAELEQSEQGLGYQKGTVFASGPLQGVEKNAVIAGVLAVLCTAALIGCIFGAFELLALLSARLP